MRIIFYAFAVSMMFVGPGAFTEGSPGTGSGVTQVSCDPAVRRCD